MELTRITATHFSQLRARRGSEGLRLGCALFPRICGKSLRKVDDMERAGCLNLSRREASRRAFLQVGSLGFLGINLPQYLRAATTGKQGKAQSCILLWLEGGPSQLDTWDPKPSSAFKPISTNVAGIQVSELLPQVAKRMDKISIVRSMHTRGTDHPQGTHYAITGHEVNPAMHFPSLGRDHCEGNGSTEQHATACARAALGEKPSVRRVFPCWLSRSGLRSDGHPRSQPQELRGCRSHSAEVGIGTCRTQPAGIS